MRGFAEVTAYVASALAQLPGPVLAVGHSYGGAVITNAAMTSANVVRVAVAVRGSPGFQNVPTVSPPPGSYYR